VRLFTGIAIAPGVVERLSELLRPLASRARLQWSPPENFHITTKFLGEWPEQKLRLVLEALEKMPKPAPFTIEIERLGFFPNAYSPRVLWAGVRAPQALAELAHTTDEALSAVGVAREARVFSPHLTLARIKPDSPLKSIRDTLIQNALTRFGASEASTFHLYLSRPQAGGSVYERIATFPLARAN
jgi:RNA 2',3'-cyclic 3'-phosphodiesterase